MPVKTPRPGDLDPIETASRDEISALQVERLLWTLKQAYDHVPHYRRKFEAQGVHPDELKTLADLARFPFTTKADLRDNYPFGLFAVPREQVVTMNSVATAVGATAAFLGANFMLGPRAIFGSGDNAAAAVIGVSDQQGCGRTGRRWSRCRPRARQ